MRKKHVKVIAELSVKAKALKILQSELTCKVKLVLNTQSVNSQIMITLNKSFIFYLNK